MSESRASAAHAEIVPSGSEPPPPVSGELGELVSASLRYPEALPQALAERPSAGGKVLAVIVGCSAAIGVLMATFAGGAQLIAVPLKTLAATLVAMVVCLPSLFVFANLTGVWLDVRRGFQSMLIALLVLALVQLSLAPIALIFSLSTDSAGVMGTIHVVFLVISALFATRALSRCWTAAGGAASSTAAVWMLLFVVVLLQLGTTLAPLLGDYAPLDLSRKRFFLADWFE